MMLIELATLLALAFVTACVCNGLKIATGEDMILERVEKFLHGLFVVESDDLTFKVSPIYYPILYCIKCMPSVYGTIISLCFLPISWCLLYQLPIVILCGVLFSTIIYNWYE